MSRPTVSFLRKLSKLLALVAESFSGLFIVAVTCLIAFQVFLRFFTSTSLAWGEEMARYLMIWAVLLASGILIRNNELIRVDFLDGIWPKAFIKYRDILYDVALIVVFFFYIVEGWDQAISSKTHMIPSLNLSWFWPYLAIPVGFFLMLCQALLQMFFKFFDPTDDNCNEGKGVE
ncbi:hypothetical protein FACS1894206_01630 [Deltaproteobacteria bacterium]|nr:hypothetical protein FACS1894206_01630 [Deltaproteobacteria bacterium]